MKSRNIWNPEALLLCQLDFSGGPGSDLDSDTLKF
jgi:hypothetical protein